MLMIFISFKYIYVYIHLYKLGMKKFDLHEYISKVMSEYTQITINKANLKQIPLV